MTSEIMTISRLRMGTDGEGISTLVTFFGCPLHCKYCINDFCHERTCWLNMPGTASYQPHELVEDLKKDEIYQIMTGGGVVFGGGEPLMQAEFIHEVCKRLNPLVQKRVETSLNVPWEKAEVLLEDIDEWIIDIKDMNPEIYKEYTGQENEQVIENLKRLSTYVDLSKFHIRIPNIPGYNTREDVEKSELEILDMLGVEAEVFNYYRF